MPEAYAERGDSSNHRAEQVEKGIIFFLDQAISPKRRAARRRELAQKTGKICASKNFHFFG